VTLLQGLEAERSLTESTSAKAVALVLAEAAASKKGLETVVLELTEVSPIADYFVVTSGTSTRHVGTLAEELEAALRVRLGRRPRSVEGLGPNDWVLLDFGDVVAHVFSPEARARYGLERLWADALRVEVE
jgi:ribosome-associated protein